MYDELFKVMNNSAEKIRLAGNPNVMVCERGTMFGYSKLSSPIECFGPFCNLLTGTLFWFWMIR